jgi:hypothetical protein
MKIKRLFESLTAEEKLELAEEIRLLLKYPEENEPHHFTPLHECMYLELKHRLPGANEIFDLMSVRLISTLKRNEDYFLQQEWYYETVTEKDLKRIRGIGRITIDEFMNIREKYPVIYK